MNIFFRLIILALLFFNSNFSYSQDEIFLKEDFDDNKNQWSVFDGTYASCSVNNGIYSLSYKSESGGYLFYRDVFINPNKDFYIEAELTQISGVDNNGFGLVWGARDFSNYLSFNISSNGYVRLYQVKNEESSKIKSWETNAAIKSMGNPNILGIRKTGNTMYFYVNDKEVHSTEAISFMGYQMGFEVNETMKVEVDYILVKAPANPINLIPNAIQGYKKENLGLGVNSESDDRVPIVSPDGKFLYITREGHPDNVGESKGEDVWVSELQEDGKWGAAKHLGFPLNNKGHNAATSVSPDGNTLILINTYNEDGTSKGGGVSMGKRTETGWDVPKDVNILNLNNKSYHSYCLTSDQKAIVMSVSRDGDTYGENDIYISFVQEDGNWSEPKNLGPGINTFAVDYAPFIAPDNVTLYFASSGRPGYGKTDIFVARRLDSTWTNWTEPQNLGPEVNTPKSESYYSIPASGNYAYLTSADSSFGGSDIFRIKVPESARPKPVALIYGKVFNSKTKEPLNADIVYQDLSTGKEVGIARTNPADGSYKIVLTYGKSYGFLAEKNGFYSVSENLDLTALTKYEEIRKDLYLAPIEVNETIRLNNLFFDLNKATLKPSSISELGRLVELLNKNPQMTIEVGGHTDNIGTDEYNLTLSQSRAKAVVDYLVSQKISAERMKSKGYGESKPLTGNETEEGRKKNRRVEFTILTK